MKANSKIEENLPEYIDWFLKSKGLTVIESENYVPKIISIKESKEVYRNRELEQTQELLVGLTQELFNKIEELESKAETQKGEDMSDKGFENEKDYSREEVKIEFSDISWLSKKLENKLKK